MSDFNNTARRPRKKRKTIPPSNNQYTLHAYGLVSDAQYHIFVKRCKDEMVKLKLDPVEIPPERKLTIFGTKNLVDSSKGTYKARLRVYIKFLLSHFDFDESLLIF